MSPDHLEDLPTYAVCRDRFELEAESVAYIVCAAHGLDTSSYTLAYVAGWAGGEVAAVRAAALTVTTAARAIITRLSDTSPEIATDPASAGAQADTAAGDLTTAA